MQDGLGHPDPLVITAGEGGDDLVRLGPQPRALDGLADRGGTLGGRQTVEGRLVLQGIDHRHFRVQGAVLRQITDALLDLAPLLAEVEPVDADVPGIRLQVAGEHLHHGGLAGPVVAQQTHDLGATDVERDMVHGLQVTIAAGESSNLDHAEILGLCSLLPVGCGKTSGETNDLRESFLGGEFT